MRGTGEKTGYAAAGGKSRPRKSLELVQGRTNMLTGEDRSLLKMYIEKGTSFAEMARLAGTGEQRIARRVRRIVGRLIDGRYVNCVRRPGKLNIEELGVSRDYFLTGLPLKSIAAKRGLTYHRARKTLKRVRRILGENLQRTCPARDPLRTDSCQI